MSRLSILWKRHKWFIGLLVFQTLFYASPHLYGVWHNDPDKYFYTGQFGYYPDGQDDINAVCDCCFYLGWGYKQAMDGHFLLEDKFQGYDTYRKVFHFWWVLGGHLARLLHIDLVTFNLLQRLLSSALLSIVLYLFALEIFGRRHLALGVVLFYQFTTFLLYPWPEASPLISNIAEVILPLGNALLVFLLYQTYRFYHLGKGNVWLISFTALMLEMDYPYAIITYSTATFGYFLYMLLAKQHRLAYLIRTALIILVPAYLVVAYNYYLVVNDYRLVYCQANNPSPPFWKILIGFLPFTLLTLISLVQHALNKGAAWSNARWYLLFFLLSNLTLIYVPIEIIPFQMEMIVGVLLPLSVFSIDLIGQIRSYRLRLAAIAITTLSGFLPMLKYGYRIMRIQKHYARPSYLHIAHYQAMQWLDHHSREEDQVLSMNYLSTYIPMLSGNRIYNGEYVLISGFWPERQAKFESAIADSSGKTMYDFLKEEKIDYILYCDSMAKIDKSGIIFFEKRYRGEFENIPVNDRVTIIRHIR